MSVSCPISLSRSPCWSLIQGWVWRSRTPLWTLLPLVFRCETFSSPPWASAFHLWNGLAKYKCQAHVCIIGSISIGIWLWSLSSLPLTIWVFLSLSSSAFRMLLWGLLGRSEEMANSLSCPIPHPPCPQCHRLPGHLSVLSSFSPAPSCWVFQFPATPSHGIMHSMDRLCPHLWQPLLAVPNSTSLGPARCSLRGRTMCKVKVGWPAGPENPPTPQNRFPFMLQVSQTFNVCLYHGGPGVQEPGMGTQAQ